MSARDLMFKVCAYVEELRDINNGCERVLGGQKCVQCRERERVIDRLTGFLLETEDVPRYILRHYGIRDTKSATIDQGCILQHQEDA